ncbi:MAG: MFS transporter [Sedimentisphaerales bacterium]|nr:MFS transporter [Sedimentisphaerales bacterium]
MNLDRKKTVFAWAMYDWANSAFATTVMAGFFPLFFKHYWCANADVNVSTARLGWANSLAGITVAMLAPILGAIADKASARKKFLIFFAYLGAAMTTSFYLVAQGNWPWAIMLFVFATIGFSGGNIFYDALITIVASEKKMDYVSALGFALGYLGGGCLFALNVWMMLQPETFGLADKAAAVKVSFVTVGLWWAVFTLPLILLVKEPPTPRQTSAFANIKAGLNQLKNTFAEIRHLKTISLFLLAYWLYIDGVDTIVRMAVDYGLSIGLEDKDLIVALLIVQFVSFPCALLFGYLPKRIGAKRSIFLALAVYIFVTIYAAFIENKTEFYIMAIFVALVQGGVQALSRSYYARIIPANKSAEYFGFYNMLGKFAVVIGPILIGSVGLIVKRLGYSCDTASRISISSVAFLFIAGGIVLYFVDEQKGKEQVEYLQ